jgi:hypothetical protein
MNSHRGTTHGTHLEVEPEAFILDSGIAFHPTNNHIDAERIRMSYIMVGERRLTSRVLGGIHKDSSGKLWSIYLAEADDQDEEITELWKGEADSILVFVSATVTYVFALSSLI